MSVTSINTPTSGDDDSNKPDLRKTGAHPDYWYPLLSSKKAKPGKAVGVSFAGEPIVIVRTKSGKLFALEDRCAHRQVPLHEGEIEGDEIKCCYHGWKYDCTGKCVSVPYVGKTAAIPRGVRAYPCREDFGFIFVFPGDPEKADSVPFPEVPAWHDAKYKTRVLDDQVACHYSFLQENLMDMNHQFLHRRIMSKISTTFLGVREGDDWVEVDYTFSRVGKQPMGEKVILGTRGDATEEKPKDLMTVRTQYPYQILKFWTAGAEHPALDLWITYVPVDKKQRINHTFGLINIRRPDIPGLLDLAWPFIIYFTNGIFGEDRWVVEMEQEAFDAQGEDWNQEIFPVVQSVRAMLIRKGVPIS
ncbi:MAG: aromatic ring-hydroxylating dioxygenase subunit alpha [Gammaproteobacteria bacterium]|jgi:renierapurpurin 18,18'-hydroxylase|nr:aromatic ring-hydroxylating dioxygenase subunit alpha [Gammaproteobacteria bacterium]